MLTISKSSLIFLSVLLQLASWDVDVDWRVCSARCGCGIGGDGGARVGFHSKFRGVFR